MAAVLFGEGTGKVEIFLGNGDGTFHAGPTYAVGTQPHYAASASLRRNGMLDLVVGDSLSDDVYVLLGNGDGTFQSPVPYPTSGTPSEVRLADFTDDGKLDILAMADQDCNCIEVLPGNGDGTFGSAIVTPVSYNIDAFGMVSGDFDGDGKLDMAVCGGFGSANQVDILLGNGDGSFRPNGFFPLSTSPGSIVTGRFNQDKNLDLVVTDEFGALSVSLGDGDGTFQPAVNYETFDPTWAAAGDLNGDGKEDLAISNSGSESNLAASSISVFLGNGDGTFQTGVVYPAGVGMEYVAIGDFNNDHTPDLVGVDNSDDAVITLLNTGFVTFSPTAPLTFPPLLLGGTTAPLTTTLTNNGSSPLTISSVSSSGKPFHAQTNCRGTIAPGGSCTVTAMFTAEVAGATFGTVTFHDSASSKPQVIELLGTGIEAKFAPTQLTFAPQKTGTKSASQTIRMTNIGATPFDISEIVISRNFFESNNCPATLQAGDSCTIHVIFVLQAKGAITGAVLVYDTAGTSTQQVPLSGTGN